MTEFTPVSAAIGGAMIGLAAVLLMLVHGRIAGISGIISGAAIDRAKDYGWRLAFIAGLFVAPLIFWLVNGAPPPVSFPAPVWLVAAGGALVGFGARLGSGCTSGHGVCGMARLSRRSFVATGVFMTSAIVTVFVVRHLIGG